MRALVARTAGVLAVVAMLGTAAWGLSRVWQPVRVIGGSMRPALLPGDLAVVRVGSAVGVGAVALFDSSRHGAVLHRIVGVNADRTFQTRGDANPVADLESLSATAVVGPVVLVVPVGRLLERWRGNAACATMTAQ